MKGKESKYIDPDELAIRQMTATKRQIIKAIDYRLSKLKGNITQIHAYNELNKFRDYVKGILYQKESWKGLFPED